jgi:thiol:disulfide interchange protein DsbC
MKWPIRQLLVFVAVATYGCGTAAEDEARSAPPLAMAAPSVEVLDVSDETLAEVRANIARRMPELSDAPLRATPLAGIYEVSHGLSFAYVTEDGRYVIEGDMVDLDTGIAITQEHRKIARAQLLEAMSERAITFAPINGADSAHTVTVFTDIDCGYCRKLHHEMEDYNKHGIAIRYLFYPRSGPNTESYRKAEAVWCQDDRHAAMTAAKLGSNVRGGGCDTPVAEHLRAGQMLGLRGTPMMILPDGDVVQGYVPAEALAARLENVPMADPLAQR